MQNVMIVEDDTILNNGICFNLQVEGINVIPAYSLKEAEKNLKQEKKDLIR